jgi:hypothetical protein
VHLFRLGSNGNYLVPRGVQRNCIFWMLIPRPIKI